MLDGKKVLEFDYKKLEEDEKYDGYYAIVTSELDMPDMEVISKYRGLWEIEETFKITKSDLKTRPIFVSTVEHIEAHFLICFIALAILRVIQKATSRLYSTQEIITCLNNIACSSEAENFYLFDYRSKISDAIGDAFGIDFTKKRLTLKEIKKNIGDVKK